MEVSPAALDQRLYRSSVLFLPPVDSGSSQASIIVVLDLLTSLTLSGGDGGTVYVCGWCVVCMWVCGARARARVCVCVECIVVNAMSMVLGVANEYCLRNRPS